MWPLEFLRAFRIQLEAAGEVGSTWLSWHEGGCRRLLWEPIPRPPIGLASCLRSPCFEFVLPFFTAKGGQTLLGNCFIAFQYRVMTFQGVRTYSHKASHPFYRFCENVHGMVMCNVHGAKALFSKMAPGRPFGHFRHFQRQKKTFYESILTLLPIRAGLFAKDSSFYFACDAFL